MSQYRVERADTGEIMSHNPPTERDAMESAKHYAEVLNTTMVIKRMMVATTPIVPPGPSGAFPSVEWSMWCHVSPPCPPKRQPVKVHMFPAIIDPYDASVDCCHRNCVEVAVAWDIENTDSRDGDHGPVPFTPGLCVLHLVERVGAIR